MRTRIKKQFWLSEEDNNELKRKAKLANLPQSTLVRFLIRSYEPREQPSDRFYAAMREQYAIGNNLNQLVAKANALGFIDVPMLRDEVKRWNQFQLKIEHEFLLPVKNSLKWE